MKNISKFAFGLVLISAPFLVLESAYAVDDRDATPEERTKVAEVLQQDDCMIVDDIDYIPSLGFKADDVQCDDGKEYDIYLDENFNIASKQEELDDRDAAPEERSKVMEVLQQDGCTVVDDVDYIPSLGFEADDVQCDDGKEYDVYLDEDFNITSKREDLD